MRKLLIVSITIVWLVFTGLLIIIYLSAGLTNTIFAMALYIVLFVTMVLSAAASLHR